MPQVTAFFDPATFTYSYIITDPASKETAIIDPVLDYDPVSGALSATSAQPLLAHLEAEALQPRWLLETHIHADHLTAAQYLKQRVGGQIAIGANVVQVQAIFGDVFNAAAFDRDGSQFDRLIKDGEQLPLGDTSIQVLFTPGHTPSCVTYVIDDCAFVGDTLFMPDYGTARTDFPGGDARTLYDSIQRILSLPDETRLFMCHDYGTSERPEYANETTVAEERDNIMLAGASSEQFVAIREQKDAGLAAPKLLYPAVQFNMRAGHCPPAEDNGKVYMKTPVRVAY